MDLSTEIQNCLLESEASEQAGDIAGAFSRTRQALQMVRARPGTAAAEASVLVRLGKLKFRLGDYAQARKLARSASTWRPKTAWHMPMPCS